MLAYLTKSFKTYCLLLIFTSQAIVSQAKSLPANALPCTLISGTLTQLPNQPLFKFKHGKKYSRTNYPMTHTQFFITTANKVVYKVVMDNLFYVNLNQTQALSNKNIGIIKQLNSKYEAGNLVLACGKLFTDNGHPGIHFVHPSDCSSYPFSGYLKINGQEITNNLAYCNQCACK